MNKLNMWKRGNIALFGRRIVQVARIDTTVISMVNGARYITGK